MELLEDRCPPDEALSLIAIPALSTLYAVVNETRIETDITGFDEHHEDVSAQSSQLRTVVDANIEEDPDSENSNSFAWRSESPANPTEAPAAVLFPNEADALADALLFASSAELNGGFVNEFDSEGRNRSASSTGLQLNPTRPTNNFSNSGTAGQPLDLVVGLLSFSGEGETAAASSQQQASNSNENVVKPALMRGTLDGYGGIGESPTSDYAPYDESIDGYTFNWSFRDGTEAEMEFHIEEHSYSFTLTAESGYAGSSGTDTYTSGYVSCPYPVTIDYMKYPNANLYGFKEWTEIRISPSGSLPNTAPVPEIFGPDTGFEGSPITLVGGFTDTDWCQGHDYRWEVVTPNGENFPIGTGDSYTFTPLDNGTYAVLLTVTDSEGASGTTAWVIDVKNVAARITTLNVNTPVPETNVANNVFLSGEFTDPSPLDTFTIVIDWGDGETSTRSVGPGGRSFSASHGYNDDNPTGTLEDPYTITARVMDDDGSVFSKTATIIVQNVAPEAEFVNAGPARVGEPVLIEFKNIVDPGLPSDTLSFEYDFENDGTFVPGGQQAVFFAFEPGEYTVVGRLKDDDMPDWVAYTTTVVVYDVKLSQVSFSGDKFHPVYSDIGTQDAYYAPHWWDLNLDGDTEDNGERAFPLSFTRNTEMKASVVIQVTPNVTLPGPLAIRGDGPDNLDFPETPAIQTGSSIKISDVSATNPFVNVIESFDPLSIDWQIKIDGEWVDVGASENPAYITLGDPMSIPYHTVVRLSTLAADGQRAAVGPGSFVGAVDAIWSEFADRRVIRVDNPDPSNPRQLTYWENQNCQAFATAALLSTGDGQCGAWAEFFLDMLQVQGISGGQKIMVREDLNVAQGMMVKNWSFIGTGSNPATAPYSYRSDRDLIDQKGVPAQGNDDPISLFVNHFIVKYADKYYDASYGGGPYLDQLTWENASLDGFYVDSAVPNIFLAKPNDPVVIETKFTVVQEVA